MQKIKKSAMKEMAKIALGKDISISFPVALDGAAVNLEGKATELHVIDYNGNAYNAQHEVKGNVITAQFPGTQQKLLGVYAIRLWLNKGVEGQNMLDVTEAFELVKTTEEENDYCDTQRHVLISTDSMSVNALPNATAYFDGEGVVINTLNAIK